MVERVHGDYMLPVSSKGRVVYVSVCDECMVYGVWSMFFTCSAERLFLLRGGWYMLAYVTSVW